VASEQPLRLIDGDDVGQALTLGGLIKSGAAHGFLPSTW
jgi:hypothetical protein